MENRIKNQSEHEYNLILKCELDFKISGVSIRELLHLIFDTGSVVFNYN